MASRTISETVRSRIQDYFTLRVLAIWSALTLLVVAYAYISVMPGYREGVLGRETIFPVPLALFALAVGGIVLARVFHQPLYALGSVVFVGLAVLPFPQACVGVGCLGVSRLHVFLDWSMFGPAVSASFGRGRCAYLCPYRVSLIPLSVGYLLIGELVSSSVEW